MASRERDTLLRAVRMALVIGTVLAFINDGQTLVAGRFTSDQLLPPLRLSVELGARETPA